MYIFPKQPWSLASSDAGSRPETAYFLRQGRPEAFNRVKADKLLLNVKL